MHDEPSPTLLKARYAHTNLIARDWRLLADFYERVFGCRRVPPERDISGPALDAATGIRGARLRGVHLRLPGHGDAGPTLEIFEYDADDRRPPMQPNSTGFGHLAFVVDDVRAARRAVLAAGGSEVGEVVAVAVPDAGTVTFVYLRDPEGNVLELQSWAR
jgi:predicted enzyme related to lactoylglutathione lyase